MRRLTVLDDPGCEIDDRGGVYRGAKAWELSLRVAAPQHRDRAQRFVACVARNRHRLGRHSVGAA